MHSKQMQTPKHSQSRKIYYRFFGTTLDKKNTETWLSNGLICSFLHIRGNMKMHISTTTRKWKTTLSITALGSMLVTTGLIIGTSNASGLIIIITIHS